MTLNFRNLINSLKIVFSKPKYVIIGIFIACMFYIANVFFLNIQNLIVIFLTFGFNELFIAFGNYIVYFYESVTKLSYIVTITLSILTGIVISMLIYRFHILKGNKKEGFIASVGIFLGIFAPGCAACGIGIATTLGLTSALVFLPFHGAEIGIIAIIIMSYALYKLSINFLVCKKKIIF